MINLFFCKCALSLSLGTCSVLLVVLLGAGSLEAVVHPVSPVVTTLCLPSLLWLR